MKTDWPQLGDLFFGCLLVLCYFCVFGQYLYMGFLKKLVIHCFMTLVLVIVLTAGKSTMNTLLICVATKWLVET